MNKEATVTFGVPTAVFINEVDVHEKKYKSFLEIDQPLDEPVDKQEPRRIGVYGDWSGREGTIAVIRRTKEREGDWFYWEEVLPDDETD